MKEVLIHFPNPHLITRRGGFIGCYLGLEGKTILWLEYGAVGM